MRYDAALRCRSHRNIRHRRIQRSGANVKAVHCCRRSRPAGSPVALRWIRTPDRGINYAANNLILFFIRIPPASVI